jgi:TadE-like protein
MFSTLQTGLKRLGTDASGQEMLEAAIIFPIFFLIVLGIFWFGRAYNIYATVTHAAAEGARVAATPTCATCATACAWPGSSLPCDNTVVTMVNSTLQASKLDPSRVAPPAPSAPTLCPGLTPVAACVTTAGGVRICRGVQLNNATSTPQACGTMVSFQYQYQFVLPFTSLLINLPASAQARVED